MLLLPLLLRPSELHICTSSGVADSFLLRLNYTVTVVLRCLRLSMVPWYIATDLHLHSCLACAFVRGYLSRPPMRLMIFAHVLIRTRSRTSRSANSVAASVARCLNLQNFVLGVIWMQRLGNLAHSSSTCTFSINACAAHDGVHFIELVLISALTRYGVVRRVHPDQYFQAALTTTHVDLRELLFCGRRDNLELLQKF